MFTFAVALALVPTVISSLPMHDGRIVGGENTTIQQYPFQVSVLKELSLFCSGSIVTPRHIVTAGHCVFRMVNSPVSIRQGSTYHEREGRIHKAKSMAWHPLFAIETLNGDVGIITLEDPIAFSETAKPVNLVPPNSGTNDGEPLFVTGWGQTNVGPMSTVLQVVQVPAVNRETCIRAYVGVKVVTPLMMCAGISGKDSCSGDSGGPLVNNRKELVGIVSWGKGCGLHGYPGVYTNIAHPDIRSFITNSTTR